MTTAFSRLHLGVQRWLYDQRWTDLRPIQVSAINGILGSTGDLIVAARTAGGKTEAAFLPILSAIADDPLGSVRVMYVGPLRALINDQFRRMELLCQDLAVPVHRWHGDIGQAERKGLLKEPGGVLLITPESLEAFFVRRQSALRSVFGRLDFVIIDELHVFPGRERGMHLRSLLHRLERIRGGVIRRIGLSATLGDLGRYRQWLRPSDPNRVVIVHHPEEGAEVRTRLHAVVLSSAEADAGADSSNGSGGIDDAESGGESSAVGIPTLRDELYRSMWKHHRQGVHLVFANAKRHLEDAVTALRSIVAGEGIHEDRILIHHGSLARDLREEAESLLQAGGDRLCCCSSTLELGIDIGSVQAVGHIGAPWSVSSLAQRLGRSGRRPGEAAVFRQYHFLDDLRKEQLGDEAHLRPDLARGIALFQLYLEGWCESADVGKLHGSTLIHQIISVIGETGGIQAADLYHRLLGGDGFTGITPAKFADILRNLGQEEIVEQISDGSLLLGPVGEREVNDRGFYAAFLAADQYAVIHGARHIGTIGIDNAYSLGDGFRLGGRGWEVEEVDEAKFKIYVRPSVKRNLPKFSGQAGLVHDRVIQQMRMILDGDEPVTFLDHVAAEALEEARKSFHRLGLNQKVMTDEDGGVRIWPWLGSKVMQTLEWWLRSNDLEVDVGAVSISVGCTPSHLLTLIGAARENLRGTIEEALMQTDQRLLQMEKYDRFQDQVTLINEIISDRFDVPQTLRWIEGISGPIAASNP